MSTTKHSRLQEALGTIQRRWGPLAIGHSAPTPTVGLSTGFGELDAVLETGVPRGRVTELLGQPTSGARTLALRVLAAAQREGQLVAYLDLGQTFDAEYAAHCGVELAHLLLVRPVSGREALLIGQALLASGDTGAIVVDETAAILREPGGEAALAGALTRYLPLLAGSETALLFLSGYLPALERPDLPGDALAHTAALRLALQHEHWLQQHDDITGYQTRVSVLKHRRGPLVPPASISITLPAV